MIDDDSYVFFRDKKQIKNIINSYRKMGIVRSINMAKIDFGAIETEFIMILNLDKIDYKEIYSLYRKTILDIITLYGIGNSYLSKRDLTLLSVRWLKEAFLEAAYFDDSTLDKLPIVKLVKKTIDYVSKSLKRYIRSINFNGSIGLFHHYAISPGYYLVSTMTGYVMIIEIGRYHDASS